MKRLILGTFVLLYSNCLLANSVKHIDGHDGSYAVTCTNGDKSGIITYHNNGQVCALSNFINTKCKTSWNKEEAARYICNHSTTTGILKKDSLVLKTKAEVLKGLEDQGVWNIKKAFASTITSYSMKVKILKVIKLKDKTFKYEANGKKVIQHYFDDAIEISDRSGNIYFTKKSNIRFK